MQATLFVQKVIKNWGIIIKRFQDIACIFIINVKKLINPCQWSKLLLDKFIAIQINLQINHPINILRHSKFSVWSLDERHKKLRQDRC